MKHPSDWTERQWMAARIATVAALLAMGAAEWLLWYGTA